MTFKVNRDDFLKVLNIIDSVVSSFDLQSISDALYFKAVKGDLVLKATNNSVYVETILYSSDFRNKPIEFITDAKRIIHIARTNTTEFLEFTLKGKNIENGEGRVEVKGNSKSILPLRNVSVYPIFPVFNDVSFKEIEGENFIETLQLLSNYVERQSLGYGAGICVSGNHVLATDNTRGVFLKEKFPISPFTLLPSSIKPLSLLSDMEVGEISESRLTAFKSDEEKSTTYIGISSIEEAYPYEELLDIVNEWRKSDNYEIEISKQDLMEASKRFSGFASPEFQRIEMNVSGKKLELYYNYNEYESRESIECEHVEDFSFGILTSTIDQMLKVASEKIKILINKEKPVLVFTNKNLLYFASILRD